MDTSRPPSPSSMRMVANSGWQLGSFAARAVGGLGAVFIVARVSGPRGLGVFQFGLTFAGLFPFYWGLPTLIAREVARKREDARRWAECGSAITFVFGGACIALFLLGAWLFGASQETRQAIVLAGVGLVLDSVARVEFAVFWAWERMRLETLATAIQEVALVAGAAIVVSSGGGVRGVLYVFIATRALGVLIAWAILSRGVGGPVIPQATLADIRDVLRRATPFAVNDTLSLTERKADAVMLGMIKGPVAVGLYQAATNLVLYFNVLARSINHAVFPRMSRLWTDVPERVGRLRDTSFKGMALIAVPVTVGSLLLAPEILRFVYGPRFDRAILTYRLLVLVIPIRMLGNTLSMVLTATDQQTRRTIAVAAAAVANVGLNIYFIPRWSYLGAAITTVITESGLFVSYALLLRQLAGTSHLVSSLSVPAVASVPLIAAVLATVNAPMPAPIVAGAAAYGAALLAFAAARPGRHWRDPRALIAALVRPS